MQVLKKYKVTAQEHIQAIEGILSFLGKEEIVSFAYIYGSFYSEDGFNDIDVAVYLNEAAVKGIDMFDFQLDLGVRLERDLNTYPIDCRALNIAPLSFRFSVITYGDLIFSRDEGKRISFEVATRGLYFDFKPHADFLYQQVLLEG